MALLLMMFLKFKVASFLKSGNVNFSELKVQSVRESSSCFLLREGASCFYRDFFRANGGLHEAICGFGASVDALLTPAHFVCPCELVPAHPIARKLLSQSVH